MFLIAGDDRHLLREGITLIGSVENDRYCSIRLQDESICPKHAALRWSAATEDLHVMDLCSHSGTQLANDADAMPREIRPLEWNKATLESTILLGSFKARLESSHPRSRKRSMSFFADDDSTDIVDCSLEEPPQIKSRTEAKKLQQLSISCTPSNGTSGSPAILENASFLIPATQQMNTTSANSSTLQRANDSRTGGNVTTEDDDDDMFYIPETQEQQQHSITEQIIDPIANTIGQGDKDDDFLRFETQDDENTGDGMFNNPYVEQSQNLLHNLDESYKRNSAKADQRKSIIPDRSVDSISFHGRIPAEDTDDDLSKIEWNETKNAADPIKDRDGSVTPELAFDKPTAALNPMLDTLLTEVPREDSITPDLEFDRITPQQKDSTADATRLSLAKVADEVGEHREQSVTPDLNFEQPSGENENDEAEISLNQEGAIDPYDLATQPISGEPEAVPSVSTYDLPTQKMLAVGSVNSNPQGFKVPSVSAYDLLTQQMPTEDIKAAKSLRKLTVGLVNLKSTMNISFKINKQIDLNPFEMATQPLPVDEPDEIYDLQTQLLPQSPNDTIPLELPPASSTSKIKRKSSCSNQPKKPPEMDPFTMATQPLPIDKPKDMYDLQTQPLPQEDDQNDTIPLDIVVHSPPRSPTDAYDMQTQPLAAKDSLTSLGDEDPEMSKHFLPRVNSTYRQSILAKQIINQEESEENRNMDDANISPSSNKENRVEVGKWDAAKLEAVKLKANSLAMQESESLLGFSQPTDEGLDEELDEEYCLAATIPVADSSSKGKDSDSSHAVTSSTNRGKRPNRKQGQDSLFKVPDSSAASSTKSSLNTGMETPRIRKGSSSDLSVETDTFDFNTPEHPFLSVAKRDKILAISDIITSRTTRTNSSARRNKYIFGDSSDEDEDPTAPVFLKEDSKLRVMKYDKDEDEEKQIKPPAVTIPERRKNRDRNRKNGNEGGKTGAGKSKTDRKRKHEDDSIDYEPPTTKPTRKRKAAEDKSEPPPAPVAKAGKSRKTTKSEPEPKAGPSSKIEEQSAISTRSRPKRGEQAINKATPVVEDEPRKQRGKSNKPSTIPIESSEDELSSATTPRTNTSSSEADSSGGARKPSRVSKPRLMFTKMSPEPYKRIITRAAARKSQR
ncbi:uncharacterized protein LOC135709435 isoform X2 [Ochlerotatus camptorhynchus]|uniref:uncharacterized protein LOC135709435 isoform X2 n=1 Tax=Ochlerotatus camptorhynchus TaxID=644619 RepID=UPI0031D0B164